MWIIVIWLKPLYYLYYVDHNTYCYDKYMVCYFMFSWDTALNFCPSTEPYLRPFLWWHGAKLVGFCEGRLQLQLLATYFWQGGQFSSIQILQWNVYIYFPNHIYGKLHFIGASLFFPFFLFWQRPPSRSLCCKGDPDELKFWLSFPEETCWSFLVIVCTSSPGHHGRCDLKGGKVNQQFPFSLNLPYFVGLAWTHLDVMANIVGVDHCSLA